MNIAIAVEMSYGERHWHVDDVVIVLIDREGLIKTVAVIENEDDFRELGFTSIDEAEKLKTYYPNRIVTYNSFIEEVRAIRTGEHKLLKWIREPDKAA